MLKCLKLRIVLLSFGLLMLNCLQYIKSVEFDSERELNRKLDKVKSEYQLNYSLSNTGIIFNLNEIERNVDLVKKEKTFKIYRKAQTDQPQTCVGSFQGSYWQCMLGVPGMTFGIGFIVTIPIMLYDWITYPFYVAFSDSKIEVVEESIPSSTKKEIVSPKAKLRFVNSGDKFDKTYSFKDGKVEIPYSAIDANLLWRSNDETVSKNYHYYYSVTDLSGKEILPKEVFNGPKFRDDKNFLAIATKAFDKAKQVEYTKCSRRFSLDNIRDGYKYFEDSGLFLRENELVVQVIINRACYNYRGTDSFDDCVDDFKSCVSSVRYIDNKNNKYNRE
ncbi:hypothetical protein CH352_00925 [Leptospira hartskeerlii]|uniref:Uncharacterized protein n=1 Tax=Leptospira hartskeerlii TaxID=2023177 RepID=A0A2M9X8E6_9LEPT|nr:hypothetical protein [Leptospira hartskeerlii]PJZ23967.1 hypothetical protein CH357_18505 [Leptospira hartskeerlii]PJZ35231.1 hypothetical protein CH352_00925 [Leptospira hartskeerlii]